MFFWYWASFRTNTGSFISWKINITGNELKIHPPLLFWNVLNNLTIFWFLFLYNRTIKILTKHVHINVKRNMSTDIPHFKKSEIKKFHSYKLLFYNEVHTLSLACHSNMNSLIQNCFWTKQNVNRKKQNTAHLVCSHSPLVCILYKILLCSLYHNATVCKISMYFC